MAKTKTTGNTNTDADLTASRIKLHKETVENGSPLALIKEKEIEINKRVLQAQEKSDRRIAKAREKAEKIKQDALDKAPQEAKQYFDEEIKNIDKEVKKIESTISTETDAVQKKGLSNFEEAVNKVLQIILP